MFDQQSVCMREQSDEFMLAFRLTDSVLSGATAYDSCSTCFARILNQDLQSFQS